MHRLLLVHLVCWVGLLAPAATYAQTAAPPQSPPSPPAKPAPDQAKPAAPAPASAEEGASRSLFEPTWRQFQAGGRVSSISGDPARYQRYRDVRDGVLFTDARYAAEDPDGKYAFHTAVDNLGWRDQRLFGDYERPGRFAV